MKYLIVLGSLMLMLSCERKQTKFTDQKAIIDTLHFGSYFKTLKQQDQVVFQMVDAQNDNVISSVRNNASYFVNFKAERLDYLDKAMELQQNSGL